MQIKVLIVILSNLRFDAPLSVAKIELYVIVSAPWEVIELVCLVKGLYTLFVF